MSVQGRSSRSSEEQALGCWVNPVPYGCLECHRAVCIHDDPQAVHHAHRDEIEEHVLHLRRIGLGKREIAQALGISIRKVYRMLAVGRGERAS